MATHSSVIAGKILRMEEPGRLQSMEWQRVRHDLVTEHIPPTLTHVTCECCGLQTTLARLT